MDGENRINVWLRRMNDDRRHDGTGVAGGSANGLVLRDTISLHETCGHLVEQGWETAGDGDEDARRSVPETMRGQRRKTYNFQNQI